MFRGGDLNKCKDNIKVSDWGIVAHPSGISHISEIWHLNSAVSELSFNSVAYKTWEEFKDKEKCAHPIKIGDVAWLSLRQLNLNLYRSHYCLHKSPVTAIGHMSSPAPEGVIHIQNPFA